MDSLGFARFAKLRYVALSLMIVIMTVWKANALSKVETEIMLLKEYLLLEREYNLGLTKITNTESYSPKLSRTSPLGMPHLLVDVANNSTVASNNSTVASPAHGNSTSSETSKSRMNKIIEGLSYSFSFIFLSEIGDKTFLFLVLYTTKMSWFKLLLIASIVLCLMHVVGVYVGNIFMMLLGAYWLKIISMVTFLVFGLLLLYQGFTHESESTEERIKEVEHTMIERGSNNEDEEGLVTKGSKTSYFGPAIQVAIIILCAEMGDRSQISAVAISVFYDFWIVAVGGCIGHILASLIAVLFGLAVSRFTTEKCTSILGGILFLAFSLHSLLTYFVLKQEEL